MRLNNLNETWFKQKFKNFYWTVTHRIYLDKQYCGVSYNKFP